MITRGPTSRAIRLLSPLALAALLLLPASIARGVGWRSAPIVPEISQQTAVRLGAELKQARAHGNRVDVFAKAGDSLSYSDSYLTGIACGDQTLAARFAYLRPTINFFDQARFRNSYTGVDCGVADSFSRLSAATYPFVVSEWATSPGQAFSPLCAARETPLACEVRIVHPAFALVMFGTNDAGFHEDLGRYRRAMGAIVTQLRRLHVVPILSTLPPRLDDPGVDSYVSAYNAILYGLARQRNALLVNLGRALEAKRVVNKGISPDGVHLSVANQGSLDPNNCVPACRPLDLTAQGLRFGYNQRNLITLRTLNRIRLKVIDRLGRG